MRTEATPATEVAKASTPLYESPIKGVRVESRRRTRRILSWLWLSTPSSFKTDLKAFIANNPTVTATPTEF